MITFIREIAILLGLLPRVIPPPPPRRVAVCDHCGREQPSGTTTCPECGGTAFSFHTAAVTAAPQVQRRPNLWAWLTLVALVYASIRIGGAAPWWNLGAVLTFGLALALLRPVPGTDWVVPAGGAYLLCLIAGLALFVPFHFHPPTDGSVAQALALLLSLVLVLSPAARGEA
jgi:hypothetical protein